MTTTKTIEKVGARFSCREYVPGVDVKSQQLSPEGKQICLLLSYRADELPNDFRATDGTPKDYCRGYNTKDGTPYVRVKIKIGRFCGWYDGKNGQKIEKPSNAELDEGAWSVVCQYTEKDKDPKNALKASGLWANNILLTKLDANPFADRFQNEPAAQIEATQPNEYPAKETRQGEGQNDPDLPF